MMARRWTFPPLALAAMLAACTPVPEELFAQAQEDFAANEYNAARVALITALKGEPGNVEMITLLARAHVALGNGEGAAARLEQLPSEVQARADIRAIRGEAEVLKGRYDDAIGVVEGLETSSADRVRALAHFGLEQFDEAAKAFEAGAMRAPVDPRLLVSYARFKSALGSLEEARALVDQALTADSKLVEAYLVRADLAEQENDLAAASDAFDDALAIHPGNFDGRLGKALILTQLGQSEQASSMAARLQREDPQSFGVALVKARVAANEGDWERVRTTLQPFEKEVFASSAGSLLYAETLIELDLPGLAFNYLQPQFERLPGSRRVRLLVARAHEANGDADKAFETIRPLANRPDATPAELTIAAATASATGDALADDFAKRIDTPSPQWVGGELAKADTALRNRQWREAEATYLTIIERVGGSNAMVLNNLAFVQERLGKSEAALGHALQAAELDPENASILDTAGWLLVQSGEREQGIAMLERAAALAPDNPSVARHLAEAKAQ